MAYDDDQLNAVYDRTGGYCHLCGRKVAFTNHGVLGAFGAWEVDHGLSRARGGGDHGNNLRPACVGCNRRKGAMASRTVRRWHGRTRSPLSTAQRRDARETNALAGAALGALIGLRVSPGAALVLSLLGGAIGSTLPVE